MDKQSAGKLHKSWSEGHLNEVLLCSDSDFKEDKNAEWGGVGNERRRKVSFYLKYYDDVKIPFALFF